MTTRTMLNMVLSLSASMLVTGCMSPPQALHAGGQAQSGARHALLPEARPLGAQYQSVGEGEDAPSAVTTGLDSEPTGPLTLSQALGLALLHNPDLTSFSYDVRAAEAAMLQASKLPNPELGVEVEGYDYGGTELDAAEATIALGQLFELGGKRRWRMRLAEAEGELAGWDYETQRLGVISSTAQRFMDVVAAQRRVELANAIVELSEKTHRAVSERVGAGKEPPLQSAKTEAELEMSRLEAQDAQTGVDVARSALAVMWAAERPAFEMAEGDLDAVMEAIPPLSAFRSRLALNPALARWESELRLREAAVSSEKAARVPDVEAAIGLQHYEEDRSQTLAFGIGIPLPLFDRNQGNIAAAEQTLARSLSDYAATESSLAAELAEAHAELTAAHRKAMMLRSKVVPTMTRAYEAAHEGYQQGKFAFLDMLDSQRGLIEANGKLVDALADYHTALVAVQGIIGTGIETLKDGE